MPQVNQIHAGNPINNQHSNVPKSTSRFNKGYTLNETMRFGEITPHFVFNAIEKDSVPYHNSHELRTYSFKAPLMSDISMKKDYFAVPIQAILPLQYERFKAQPNMGDDVPSDVYTSVEDFWPLIKEYFSDFQTLIATKYADIDWTDPDWSDVSELIEQLFSFFIQAEYFFSSGSLLNYLGVATSNVLRFDDSGELMSFDKVFDEFISKVNSFVKGFQDHDAGPVWFRYSDSSDYRDTSYHSMRSYLEWLRDNGASGAISSLEYDFASQAAFVAWVSWFSDPDNLLWNIVNKKPVDLARLFAYQIVCAHFYSNDAVDYVYSADLYRQNIFDIVKSIAVLDGWSESDSYFSWNGLKLPFDYCSSHFFNLIFTNPSVDEYSYFGKYLSLIFAFRHSLRFVDYFTGSRTRPLAVGDTSVTVSAGKVDVVDVTRNIQLQRFYNAVNRAGRKIGNYVKELFDVVPEHDFHDPEFLAHTSDTVFNSEVQNTADSQVSNPNSITSNMRSNASKYAFTFHCDRLTILIGVTYFDIPRLYSDSTDRETMIQDRNDWFNPMLQFIGDQPIYAAELTDKQYVGASDIFGYTGRYMEFKQGVSRAVGGFKENLPGFAFLADNVPGLKIPTVIGPSYIRSSNCELDPFYVSLTGWSNGSYFHFIIKNVNDCTPVRNMAYNPQIL